jgi:hypothetical protein
VWISRVFTNSKLGFGNFKKGVECVVEGKHHKGILSSFEFSMFEIFL